jgi:predicted dienelactone hydrolase
VLDRLLRDSLLGPRIDSTRIGAAGFSLGGYTVVALAGGHTDLQRFETFCASPERDFTCQVQPELPGGQAAIDTLLNDSVVSASLARAGEDYRDGRIRAVAALSPAVAQAFTPASLHAVGIPVLVVGGEADRIAPPGTNARAIAREVPGAALLLLPRVRHYSFLSTCTQLGRRVTPDTCSDEPGVSRDAIHARVSSRLGAFFDRALRPRR